MGNSNYCQYNHAASPQGLAIIIEAMIQEAESWVDARLSSEKSEEILLLEKLGFK